MKRVFLVSTLIAVVAVSVVPAQVAGAGNTLAATMNVYVFPSKGQDASQQSIDETDCYNWAVSNTGNDPFSLAKQSQQQQQQAAQARAQAEEAGKGSGAKGALGGAAGGALIGEIASDDPGKGAAIGAGIGFLAGRQHRKKAKQKAEADVDSYAGAAQAATQQELDNFKKAFSVCLEAKDYMVKY